MKVETTIALPEDLVAALESRARDPRDLSTIIEDTLRAYLAQPRLGDDAGDLKIINAHSAELNEEASDVLEYLRYSRPGASPLSWKGSENV